MGKTSTPSIYMRDRPDLMDRLEKLQENDRLKMSTVIKCALDATLTDIEKNKDKRRFKLNGKEVELI